MKSRIAALLTAALGAAACLSVGATAHAYPDAKVEAQTRPDFGLLLRPPLHHRHHLHRIYEPGCRFYCGTDRGGPPVWNGPLMRSALVDCEDPYQRGTVNDVIRRIEPGGVLVIRGGAECVGPIFVDHPITIEGQGGRAFREQPLRPQDIDDQFSGGAVIVNRNLEDPNRLSRGHRNERPDLTCMIINVPTKELKGEVILRNLTLRSGANTSESCVHIESGVVRMQDVYIDYSGTGSAVFVGADAILNTGRPNRAGGFTGQALGPDVIIHALHSEAALDVEGGLSMHDAEIIGGRIGLNFETDGQDQMTAEVTDSIFVMPKEEAPAPGFDRGSGGVVAQGRGGILNVQNNFICGYGIGAYVLGSNTLNLQSNYICGPGKGVSAAGGAFTAVDNAIATPSIGIEFGAGSSTAVSRNHFYGMQYPFFIQPGGRATGVTDDNEFYNSGRISNEPRDGNCRWAPIDEKAYFRDERRRPKWRSWRHMYYLPHWRGSYGICRDPAEFSSIYLPFLTRGPQSDISLEEYFFGADPHDRYHVEVWPESRVRVPEPFDHYDWDHPDYYHDEPRRWF